METSRSRALFERAQRVLPGGVNSPVRAFRSVGGDPLFIARAEVAGAGSGRRAFSGGPRDEGGVVIPMFANWVFATGPEVVTGDEFSSVWDMDGERWMERWSFA